MNHGGWDINDTIRSAVQAYRAYDEAMTTTKKMEELKMNDGYGAYCIADVFATLGRAKKNMPVNYAAYAKAPRIPTPKKIIVSEDSDVTVVLWDDNTKTIVKCSEADQYDSYAAYCAAFAKKCYGTNSQLKKTIENLTVFQESKKKKGSSVNGFEALFTRFGKGV